MNKSSEEVEADHLQVLGPRLGPLYHELYNEVVWLHVKWKQYRHLYATAENVDLLNGAAGFFFGVVQRVMWDDALLHVARLMDRPGSMGKDNLTLLRLPEAVEDVALSARVVPLVKAAVSACGFARDLRNRRLAHRDLQLALDSGAEPLPGVSRAQMEEALAAMRAVLNEIQGHYWNSRSAFEDFLAPSSDAMSLTHYLSEALKAERKQIERLRRGEVLPEDLDS